jgi:hypothetical protein
VPPKLVIVVLFETASQQLVEHVGDAEWPFSFS